mmetsp:Transcript_39761/g.81793  ORF Transcript_39761/g.81793 Transcript_39761/m.81793 type:complete len:92 (+) Transcript_39761:252-527(+)
MSMKKICSSMCRNTTKIGGRSLKLLGMLLLRNEGGEGQRKTSTENQELSIGQIDMAITETLSNCKHHYCSWFGRSTGFMRNAGRSRDVAYE